jgi:hypothetical protein
MSKKADDIKALKLDIKQVARTTSVFNQNQVQKLWNSTREVYKYSRPAKGGGEWTYVKSSYVRKVLDSVFGFNWDFDIETSLAEAFEIAKATKMCVVKGTIVGRVWHDGQWVEIKKTQFGRAEVKFKKNSTELLDFGNDMKAATSDCLKKCASLFGIAQDVYEASEFMEIEIIGSDENSDRAKQAEKRIKKAKKVLTEEAKTVGGQNDKH